MSAEQRPPAPGFQWPQPSWPVALLPVYTGGEASDGLSKVNRAEVDAVAAVVQGLCAAGLSAAEIGVVSPYAAQVRLLRHRLRGGGGGGGGGGDPAAVEVSSVD